MESLFQFQGTTSMNDVKKLRQIYDKVEIHVRGLQALGVGAEQYGTLLIPIMMSKIPEELRLIISRQFDDENWNLDELLKALRVELEARERSANASVVPIKNSRPFNSSTGNQPSAAALVSSDTKVTCTYCRGPHPSVKCSVVTDVVARKSVLKKQGRCFVCLRKSHLARECPSPTRCFRCHGRHHSSVCEPRYSQPPETDVRGHNPVGSETRQPSTAMFIDTKTSVLLQTAIAWVSRVDVPEQRVRARLIFDTGSQRSYISSRLRESLKLPTVKTETLMIKTFGSETGQLQSRDQVQLCVYGAHAGADTHMSAYSVPVVCSPLQNQAIQFASANYPHLRGLALADSKPEEELQVDILVGADFYWHFLSGGVRRGENGPTALETKLGWMLSGPVDHEASNASTQANFTNTHALRVSSDSRNGTLDDTGLDRQLSQFWELESIGIIPDEESVYDQFKNDIQFKDGRYQVKLPWKEPHIAFPDNYGLSRGRLTSLTRRLKAEQLMEEYDAVIRDQLNKGIIERVNKSHPTVSHTHYLPHHPVIRRDKETTKMRVVYDASARTQGHPSLNDCLYSGPCLLPSIVDVLVRFRLNKVALVADIEKAFLMISVAPGDRDALRFLWYDDVTQDNPQEVVYRFCRVVFGVTSSPFLLNATISHHLSRYASEDPDLVRRLLDSLYVDDLSGGEANVERGFDTFVKSKKMFAEGGFNLRKWSTNSPELRQRIKDAEDKTDGQVPQPNSTTTQGIMEEDTTYTKSTLGNDKTAGENGHQKVLGQTWNFQEDSLIFQLDHLAELARELPATKRSILKIVAKIFDPLGVLSPIVIEMKVLFQELCGMKAAWDDPLPEQLHRRWSAWCSDLAQTASLQIPRCYLHQVTGDSMTYQLHGFCDSSQTGYEQSFTCELRHRVGSGRSS